MRTTMIALALLLGPRTPEGLQRSRMASWKHGRRAAEARAAAADRGETRRLIAVLRRLWAGKKS